MSKLTATDLHALGDGLNQAGHTLWVTMLSIDVSGPGLGPYNQLAAAIHACFDDIERVEAVLKNAEED